MCVIAYLFSSLIWILGLGFTVFWIFDFDRSLLPIILVLNLILGVSISPEHRFFGLVSGVPIGDMGLLWSELMVLLLVDLFSFGDLLPTDFGILFAYFPPLNQLGWFIL